MGVFFTRQESVAAAVRPRLLTAHLAREKNEAAAAASTDTDLQAIEHQVRPTFSVPRFLCAVAFVIVLFGLYYLSAHDPGLANRSEALFSLFEILTSGLTVLLVGEASASG